MKNELIKWLQDWYSGNCDGEWEHSFGLKIETLDNPGWIVRFEVTGTVLEDLDFQSDIVENDENDWHHISVKDGWFQGAGDPHKLEYIVQKLRETILANKTK